MQSNVRPTLEITALAALAALVALVALVALGAWRGYARAGARHSLPAPE